MEKRSRSNSKAAVIRCKWQYRRDSLRCISNGKIANADKFFRGRYCLGEEEFAVKICIRKNPENLSERSAVGKSIAGKKKEDSIITRKSIVCARKVLQNIMESGTNFTRKNISERSTGDEVCGHMITLGTGVPGTAM